MADGTEPIEDEEYLYRRVQIAHFDPAIETKPSPMAFHPRRYDAAGISVWRAKYRTPEQAAENSRDKRYYIAVLRAGDLRAHGLDVVPDTAGSEPGHAVLPALTYENRHNDAVREAEQLLARKLCLEVLGPLP